MSAGEALRAVLVGVLVALPVVAIRIGYVLWTTRINTLGDYLVALILWIDQKKREKRK